VADNQAIIQVLLDLKQAIAGNAELEQRITETLDRIQQKGQQVDLFEGVREEAEVLAERVSTLTGAVNGLNQAAIQGNTEAAAKIDVFSDALEVVLSEATAVRDAMVAVGEDGGQAFSFLNRSIEAGTDTINSAGSSLRALKELADVTLKGMLADSASLDQFLASNTEAAEGFQVAIEQIRSDNIEDVRAGLESLDDFQRLAAEGAQENAAAHGDLADQISKVSKQNVQLIRGLTGTVTAAAILHRELRTLSEVNDELRKNFPGVAGELQKFEEGLSRFQGPVSFVRSLVLESASAYEELAARLESGTLALGDNAQAAIDTAKGIRQLRDEVERQSDASTKQVEQLGLIVEKLTATGDLTSSLRAALAAEASEIAKSYEEAGKSVPIALEKIREALGQRFTDTLSAWAVGMRAAREELRKLREEQGEFRNPLELSTAAMDAASDGLFKYEDALRQATERIRGNREEIDLQARALVDAVASFGSLSGLTATETQAVKDRVNELLDAFGSMGERPPAVLTDLANRMGVLRERAEATRDELSKTGEAADSAADGVGRLTDETERLADALAAAEEKILAAREQLSSTPLLSPEQLNELNALPIVFNEVSDALAQFQGGGITIIETDTHKSLQDVQDEADAAQDALSDLAKSQLDVSEAFEGAAIVIEEEGRVVRNTGDNLLEFEKVTDNTGKTTVQLADAAREAGEGLREIGKGAEQAAQGQERISRTAGLTAEQLREQRDLWKEVTEAIEDQQAAVGGLIRDVERLAKVAQNYRQAIAG
jgi:chromosome segregation ATPase